MKCIISGSNVKVFAKALHALSKIGDELYVESHAQGLAFRALNSSRSAFTTFDFKAAFFSFFDCGFSSDSLDNAMKCKVVMKACVIAFKSLANIERSVEKCKIVMNPDADELSINFTCKYGVRKMYNLSIIECEALEAVFEKSSCPFRIACSSHVLCDSLVNFHSNQEEVTLSVSTENAVIKSYIVDEIDFSSTVYTELTLEAAEFDEFVVNSQCEVTFCLKELRALLAFSEPFGFTISISFSKPGRPLIVSLENQTLFEANFVLATLANPTSSQLSSHISVSSFDRVPSSNRTSLKRPSEVIEDRIEQNVQRNLARHASESIAEADSSLNGNAEALSSNGVTENEAANGNCQEAEDSDEMIPGTPPAKKRSFIFKRCFEPTFHHDQIPGRSVILAEDSDPDDEL